MDSSFSMPSGSSEELINRWRETSDFSSLLKEPNLLTDLFSAACSDQAWCSNNKVSFVAIVAEINALEESGNSEAVQLEKIASICKKTLLSPHEMGVEALLLGTYEKALSLERAFDFLLSEEGKEESALVERSLAFVAGKTGCEIRIEEGKLTLNITNMDIKQEELLEFLSKIGDEKRKKITINLSLESCFDKDVIEALVKRFGKEADSLSLGESVEDDDQLEKLITDCPKITSLFILNNKITTIPSLPAGLKRLDCSCCEALKKLPVLSLSLTHLNCNQCSTLEELPSLLETNLMSLNCNRCVALKKIPPLPASLEDFYCDGGDAIEELPVLPAGLKTLVCSRWTTLKKLPDLPESLKTLQCNGCIGIEELPALPASLTSLNCDRCSALKKLPVLPLSLTYLNCNECSALEELPSLLETSLMSFKCNVCVALKKIPLLPASLKVFGFSACSALEELPSLFETKLTNFLCTGCVALKKIPPLPPSLEVFHCDGNNVIEELPDLPAGLKTLMCSRLSALKKIPALPPSLEVFHCDGNNVIEELPDLPAGLKTLMCSRLSALKKLPALSLSLMRFDCSSCSFLTSSSLFQSLLPLYRTNPEKGILLANSSGIGGGFLGYYAELVDKHGNDAEEEHLISFFKEFDFNQILRGIAGENQLLAQYGEERIRQFFASPVGKLSVFNEKIDKLLVNRALLSLLMTIYPPMESDNYRLYLRSRLDWTILRINLTQGMALQLPDRIFEKLKEHVPKFPSLTNIKVKHPESPGIDADGLGRQFIADFILGIVTNSQLFTFEECHSGKRRPVEKLEKEEHEKELANYEILGAILGLALKIKYKTGLLFSEKLFGAMLSFSYDEIDQEPFDVESFIRKKSPEEFAAFFEDAIDNEGYNQLLFPLVLKILTSQDEKAIREAVKAFQNEEYYEINDKEKFIKAIEKLEKAETAEAKLIVMNEIKGLALDEWLTLNRGYLEIAHALAKGMKKLLSDSIIIENQMIDNWEKLQALPLAAFTKALEGELSAASIKNNLVFTPENFQLEGWMKKWLDDHADDEIALGNFLREVTGAPVLQGPIRVKLVEAIPLQELPSAADGSSRSYQPSHSISTCYSTINFLDTIDEETFIAVMDASAVKGDADYNQD